MLTTKKIAIQCTQKEVKEFKHFTTKSTKQEIQEMWNKKINILYAL